MKSLAKLRKGVYPRPVYEAHFDDNTYVRLSFWSQAGKPLAVNRARDMIQALTRWSPAGVTRVAVYGSERGCRVRAPYTPIERGLLSGKRLVRGYVEHDVPDQPFVRFVDPYFMPHAVEGSAKRQRITAKAVKTVLADLVAYLDGDGPDDAFQRARDLIAA